MIARKTEADTVYLKLTFINEESSLQDGFTKWKTNDCLPPIQGKSFNYHNKSLNKQIHTTNRFPKNNSSVLRIFNAISKGNLEEVNFSIQFVSFEDSYYNNQTASIASLFCENPIKRKLMIKTIMKWNFNFKSPDLTFLRDPLHWCCILGYKEEYDLIIDYLNGDVDYHSKDIDGNTYLHLAVISNSIDIVKSISNSMVVNEISADVCNLLGFTPYILSRKLGYRDISMHIQSTPIASLNIVDNVFHLTPREWSILGCDARKKSSGNLKVENQFHFNTFKIAEIVNESSKEPKNIDINKVIHSAYIIWASQHVESFRKLARNRQHNAIKTKFTTTLPPVQKKTKCK